MYYKGQSKEKVDRKIDNTTSHFLVTKFCPHYVPPGLANFTREPYYLPGDCLYLFLA